MKRYEIRLSGAGGQGLILAGVILAEAVGIYDGKNVVQSQSYGPEARGGASKSEVIISQEEINYPKATSLDALLCLTQEACDKYLLDLKLGGMLLADEDLVSEVPQGDFRLFRLPMVRLAKEHLGNPIVANMVALGAMARLTGVVEASSLERAVLSRVTRGTEDLNRQALQLGFDQAGDLGLPGES